MEKKSIHLVCNAHIDPVWLWEWPEGLAETLSTFRLAVEFCQKNDGFIFCHNEALLYQWVGEYEPSLLRKIKKLIAAGNWKVIGGWYVQPDCNMPSGESFVRQTITGKKYFINVLDTEPTTAVNFDPFGHSRGLVQILNKSGYNAYLFCRPDNKSLDVPDDFIWTGFDGSEIMAHRSYEHYNSERGKADEKIKRWIESNPDRTLGMVLWGIGNHGGGPSKEDIRNINSLKILMPEWDIHHSGPDQFFAELASDKENLPKIEKDLNPWAVGCYSSMSKVKRKHRELENQYLTTESMATHAVLAGLEKYPREKLQEALEDLLFCQFHDILPGSGIQEVESYALQRLDHGLEILSRIKTKAFFSLTSGYKKAQPEEFPIFVYNPYPYTITDTIICEIQGPEPNFDPEVYWLPELTDEEGNQIEYQIEKESSNIQRDHRKRLVFNASLNASSMNRFSCFLKEVDILQKPTAPVQSDLNFANDLCEVMISPETGLIDRYKVNGVDYLRPDSVELLVMKDDPDPWGMRVFEFRELIGRFRLMSPAQSAEFAGTNGAIAPIRIIEEGPIRSVIEALFTFNNSTAAVKYFIPKEGTEIELEVKIYWMEKDKMLKLAFPSKLKEAKCLGQVAYGVQEFNQQGDELIAQQWIGLFDSGLDKAMTIANRTTYGFDVSEGELRLSLLRAPAYAGHPVEPNTPILRQDRLTPRIDQGEHLFHFRINAGPAIERLTKIDLESNMLNKDLIPLCVFPSGRGKKKPSAVLLSNPNIRLGAFKMGEDQDCLIVRLFEPSGQSQNTNIELPLLDLNFDIQLNPFEIKTFAIDLDERKVLETNLLEQLIVNSEQ